MPHRLKIIVLAGQLAMGAWDSHVTRVNLANGGVEDNPIARPFVHSPALYAGNAVLSLGAYWLSRRMEHSKRPWVRRMQYLPQTLDVAGHGWGVAYTLRNGANR